MNDAPPPARRDADRPPRAPRWVKVAALLVLALLVVMAVVLLVSGGEHGPRRHFDDGAPPAPRHTPPAGIPDHAPPQP